ncbi:unnamed protein product [Camellia sinensis]
MMAQNGQGMDPAVLDDIINRLLEFRQARSVRQVQVQLSEAEIRQFCTVSREIFLQQPNLFEREAPVKICGFDDLFATVTFLLQNSPGSVFITTHHNISGHHLIELLMAKWGLKCTKLLDGFSFMPSYKAFGLSGNIQLAEIVLNNEEKRREIFFIDFHHYNVQLLLRGVEGRNIFSVLLSIARVQKFSEVCNWLPDDLKEEYVHSVKVVEKAVLRAVIFPCFSILFI